MNTQNTNKFKKYKENNHLYIIFNEVEKNNLNNIILNVQTIIFYIILLYYIRYEN